MANVIYPKYKEGVIQHAANTNMSAGNIKLALVDLGVYTYNAAHQFLSSLSGIIATSGNLTGKTFLNGTFDADDVTLTGVTGASSEALVFYVDSGAAGTSPLIVLLDSGYTNLPVTPNGGNIIIQFNAAGIFRMGA